MKRSEPLPRQKDALRQTTVPISAAKALPARSVDLLIQIEEEKGLLALIAPSFLTPNELAVIMGMLDRESRRDIAGDLGISLAAVMDYEREALESIKQHFPRALAEYERKNFIARKAQRRLPA